MKAILLEKCLALALTLGLVSYYPWQQVVLLYIVFGQGHFLIAYLYQYKAGKMTGSYLATAAISLALICGIYFTWPNEKLLVAITTIYFLAHMLLDEMYLLRLPMDLGRSPMSLGRLLEMSPILLLYSARVVEALFSSVTRGSFSFGRVCLAASWLAVLALMGLVLAKQYKLDVRSIYFLSASAFLLWAFHTRWLYSIPTGKLTGFVIIYHYLCWYFHYFLQLKSGVKKRTYISRVLVVNAIVISAFLYWGKAGIGKFFFQRDFFYIWTLLHLITSTRPKDVKQAFRVSPPS